MKDTIDKIRELYPHLASLIRAPSSDEELKSEAREIGLPEDYYELYESLDGEDKSSDGLFGLHKMLSLKNSLKLTITDPEALRNIPKKFQYDLFVPIFKTPGRQLIGYAKHGNNWDFAESDIWLGRAQYPSLSEFMRHFDKKLRSNGYTTEDGVPGLIDRHEM